MTQCATNEVKTSNTENKPQWELVFERKREEYLENNLTDIRALFEEFLINDCDYSSRNISEVWDWRDERLEKEKQIYIQDYKDQRQREAYELQKQEDDLSFTIQ